MKLLDINIKIPEQPGIEKMLRRTKFWFDILEFFTLIWDYEINTHPYTKVTSIYLTYPRFLDPIVKTILIGRPPTKKYCKDVTDEKKASNQV